jgi:serine/threonine protein phosphatase PrpC
VQPLLLALWFVLVFAGVTAVMLYFTRRSAPAPDPVPVPAPQAAPPLPPPDPDDEDEPGKEEITMISFRPMVLDGPALQESPEPARPAAPRAAEDYVQLITRDAEAAIEQPTAPAPLLLLSAVAQTHRGRKRKVNEDSFVVQEDRHLFVVADGMGGHTGGKIASHQAVDTIAASFDTGDFGDLVAGLPRDGAELAASIQSANQAVWEQACKDTSLKGMGTTVVAVRFAPAKARLYIGHVGDSRCYRLRDGVFEMLTSDHTLAAMGVRGQAGEMLTRAVGVTAAVKIDLILAAPRPGDVFLLCSDGLTKMVSETEIAGILANTLDPEIAVHALIEQANHNGGKDNITAIVIQVHDVYSFEVTPRVVGA